LRSDTTDGTVDEDEDGGEVDVAFAENERMAERMFCFRR